MKNKLIALLLLSTLIFSQVGYGQESTEGGSDQTITLESARLASSLQIQATLRDQNGSLIEGRHTLVIYFRDESGTVRWQERHDNVAFNQGVFLLVFGTINPIPAQILADSTIRFGIIVDPEDPNIRVAQESTDAISAEIELRAVPKAMYADLAGEALSVSWNNVQNKPGISDLSGQLSINQLGDNFITNEKIITINASKVVGTLTDITIDGGDIVANSIVNDNLRQGQFPNILGVGPLRNLTITENLQVKGSVFVTQNLVVDGQIIGQIDYNNLINTPNIPDAELFYTKVNLQTEGEADVNFLNLTDVPDFIERTETYTRTQLAADTEGVEINFGNLTNVPGTVLSPSQISSGNEKVYFNNNIKFAVNNRDKVIIEENQITSNIGLVVNNTITANRINAAIDPLLLDGANATQTDSFLRIDGTFQPITSVSPDSARSVVNGDHSISIVDDNWKIKTNRFTAVEIGEDRVSINGSIYI